VSQRHFEGALVKRLILLIVCGVGVVALPVMAGSWRMRPMTPARDLVPGNPALFASASAEAAAACSPATLRGSYGIAWRGASDTIGTGAAAGIITFDGAGGIGGYGMASIDGGIIDRTWSGTYQMRSDCAGSATINSNLGVSVSVVFVTFNDGKDLQFLETDAGTVMTGTARRIDGPACSNQTARGTHLISFTGTGTGGVTGAALSRFAFDGNGAISGSGAASLAGTPVLRTFTGSYAIRPDCSGTATITSDLGGTITLGLVLLDQGHAGYFVGITPGMTLNGATTRVAD
jgi:hypothetical protein